LKKQLKNSTVLEKYDEQTFGFRQLFLKLFFEQLIDDLDLTHNFEMIYEFIKVFGPELKTLKLKMIDKKSLKSNHYWIMAILPKLKQLKHLIIYRGVEKQQAYPDFFKFLVKAFDYFKTNGGSLDSFTMTNM
jgi:hypothetical protein